MAWVYCVTSNIVIFSNTLGLALVKTDTLLNTIYSFASFHKTSFMTAIPSTQSDKYVNSSGE